MARLRTTFSSRAACSDSSIVGETRAERTSILATGDNERIIPPNVVLEKDPKDLVVP